MEFVQIVGAHDFTCGITLDQTVHCWGDEVSGVIPGLYEQISAASMGNVACGVQTDGKINCWGKSLRHINHFSSLELIVRRVC
jgi:hypothetical protein